MDDDNLVMVLQEGEHYIHIDSTMEGPSCGLVPLMGEGPAFVETTGLKWNLDGTMPLAFGQFISTSNRIEKTVVSIQVKSANRIIYTHELHLV